MHGLQNHLQMVLPCGVSVLDNAFTDRTSRHSKEEDKDVVIGLPRTLLLPPG